MEYNVIGQSPDRWDAHAKVTGKAKFTADYPVRHLLHGKILRSTIAHGKVVDYDISAALQIPGVVKILLPEDVPQNKYGTAGHPWSLVEAKRDIEDRTVLTRHIRQYGDEIGAVVAEDEIAAIKALEAIRVTYEEYPVYLEPEESMAGDAMQIHAGRNNIAAATNISHGNVEEDLKQAPVVVSGYFKTSIQQHAHMENQVAVAYQDEDQRWVCMSSTQIPHICRRIIGQALGIAWSHVRVKKPFIGGGFGNKQDVTIEPLAVVMSMACGGRPVQISLTREESLAYTRTRHAIAYHMKAGVTQDGRLLSIDCDTISNQGAYASHGHSVGGKGGGFINALYKLDSLRFNAKTVYTNIGVGGAMRGYGIPQVMFALEALVDDVADEIGADPIEFRIRNMVPEGTTNALTTIVQHSNKIDLCLQKGRELFDWDTRMERCTQTKRSTKRRGLGVASFAYGSGTYPFGLEIAGARLILIQDGSFKLMLGATEIGQGSDTALSQLAAEVLSVPVGHIIVDALTDTDTAPFDTGAYASRQTYVTGRAVKEAATKMKNQLLALAARVLETTEDTLELQQSQVVDTATGVSCISLAELAMISFYHMDYGHALVAEAAINCHENSYAYGASFVEVEVDTITGQVTIVDILNVQDSGRIINHTLAGGQVQGGMAMGIAFGMDEGLRYNAQGKPLNNNLLDYKVPTIMDTPQLHYTFVESDDPLGPFGNKSLGENPLCSPAPAIRNAIKNAVGIRINTLPITSQAVFEHLKQAGIC